jgi:hypothetical protein
MPFASTSLGAEQPLVTSELLGYSRAGGGGEEPWSWLMAVVFLIKQVQESSSRRGQRLFRELLAE